MTADPTTATIAQPPPHPVSHPDREGDRGRPVRVVHVDDEPDLADLTAEFLEREAPELAVHPEPSPHDALEYIQHNEVECVVSDYEMPGMDGLELLRHVREHDPRLPFILFTGKGSEEIASDAISKGVTDYLQKAAGTDQYTVLANRIRNAVAQHRAERALETRTEWYRRILYHSSDYVMIVDQDGQLAYVSPAIERVVGYTPDAVIGTEAFQYVHEADLEAAVGALSETIQDPDREITTEFRATTSEGGVRWLETRGSNFLEDPLINGVMVNVRDITTRKQREQAVKRQKNHLQELTAFLSHDVKNQLRVAEAALELAREDGDPDRIERAAAAVGRVDQIVDQVERLARCDEHPIEPGSVRLDRLAQEVWETVGASAAAALVVEPDLVVCADPDRLRSLLENLLGNAFEHAGPAVTVRVQPLADGDDVVGFVIEDDGPGIPEDIRGEVFEPGVSAAEEGSGLGLAIVARIADAHGWTVALANRETRSGAGGARFEITTSGGGRA